MSIPSELDHLAVPINFLANKMALDPESYTLLSLHTGSAGTGHGKYNNRVSEEL